MLIVTLVSALLPLKIWNMIVSDVLTGKIFIAVICEDFAVFIGSIGIIMIKDALKKELMNNFRLRHYKKIWKNVSRLCYDVESKQQKKNRREERL